MNNYTYTSRKGNDNEDDDVDVLPSFPRTGVCFCENVCANNINKKIRIFITATRQYYNLINSASVQKEKKIKIEIGLIMLCPSLHVFDEFAKTSSLRIILSQ